ncbi:hypothetical protein [Gimesia panareensis]|uniref:hypothetical protein n=1 Tax=Gimesia panareensis TaxID=2527978 RepID=UPI0011880DA3|nr:hypothetical protein [Gimesia panareensis]QDU48099.1 hypothetical protein Pan110_04110 [Gimesia panareensis]
MHRFKAIEVNTSSLWNFDDTHMVSPQAQNRPGNRYLITCLTILWVGLILFGMSQLWRYQTTPGETSHSPAHWPSESQTTWNAFRPTLIMFAHPRCPCTRASISELAQIMAYGSERVDARIEFFKPADFPQDWEKSDLWESASAIPGVTVSSDLDGDSARRFGATTSGFVVLYNTKGELVFQGGITGSRGHTGDNTGRTAVLSILSQGNSDKHETLTYGCPLLGQNQSCRQEMKK